MPDPDDMPGHEPDPMDQAYLRAEQALDGDAARSVRRARLLAAVAQEMAAPTGPASSAPRPMRRYGGWLAAACVAGLSVWTAGQVYRFSLRKQSGAPAVQSPAPPAAKTLAPPPAPEALSASAPPPVTARARPRPVVRSAPIAPPPDIVPPPPLPIPPVEKPIPAPQPAAPPPPMPALAAKSGLAAADAPRQEAQSVVVTGSRIERRDFAASAPVSLGVLQSRMLAEAARLRYDAAVGRTADIEALLAQGVPVDAADQDGETALMKSIRAGQREVAALLLRHGASLDLRSLAGVSARDMAAAKHDPELDKALGITPSAAAPP